jgi:DNA-directed RNA polymerase specialized sigma24 family protein
MLVAAAGELDRQEGRRALGELVQRYRAALTRYLLRRFCPGDETLAGDLFDAFVAHILVEKEALREVRPLAGYQFRSFLLNILHNFAVSEFRRQRAQKRRPVGGTVPLEGLAESEVGELAQVAPQDFDLAWAREVVQQVIARMDLECRTTGRADVWGVFELWLRRPILEGAAKATYEQLVEQFGFASPAQAQNALVTAKRRFHRILREVIGEYVPEAPAVETELRELLAILAHAPGREP